MNQKVFELSQFYYIIPEMHRTLVIKEKHCNETILHEGNANGENAFSSRTKENQHSKKCNVIGCGFVEVNVRLHLMYLKCDEAEIQFIF